MQTIFKAEKRFTIVERVIEQIRDAINSGRLKPGDHLIEKDIADSMQIGGRAAVREAFRYLEKEGFVTIIPFKGAHVTLHDIREIQQMFEVMSGLEGMCARFAALRMTQKDLEKIEALHADLEKYYERHEPEKYLETNWIVHELIQKLADNDVLDKVVNELRQKISLYRKKQLYQPYRFEASINEHRMIMKAFQEKDADAVEMRMRQHLIRQGESLIEGGEDKTGK